MFYNATLNLEGPVVKGHSYSSLFDRKGMVGHTLLALALQSPLMDIKKYFCFTIDKAMPFYFW